LVPQATQDIRKLSLWLGDSNLTTTKIYHAVIPARRSKPLRQLFHHTCGKGSCRRLYTPNDVRGIAKDAAAATFLGQDTLEYVG
jgi:hypothetical protein